MPIQLYNTLTRKKEEFVPLAENRAGIYTCGPTVYNYAHIGNLRSYIFADVLKRILLFNGLKVKQVMNITDVGHLTSDADEGEDKMLKGAKREKKTVWEIAEFYTDAFKRDIRKLNILPPDIWCRATDHITEQIEMIKILEKKGFTYLAGGNVYFNTAKLKDYGKLARLNLNEKGEKGVIEKARVEKDPNKKNPHDFVLWFTKSKFQEQEMKWKSPWGLAGYPGWHIECSAMSSKYLGRQFDIHTGGIDHIPVHHTNEIAQSEAAFGRKPWVKYWLHGEFLVLEKEKMAKSGENFIILSRLEEKGFAPLDYRYFCLGTHYRKPLMFSYEGLEGAKKGRRHLVEKMLELRKSFESGKLVPSNKKTKTSSLKLSLKPGEHEQRYLKEFTAEVNDDLNTPKALAVMWEMLKDNRLEAGEKYALLLTFDEVLGLGLKEIKPKKPKTEKIPPFVLALAEEREKARKGKDWAKADELREEIRKLGFGVDDEKEGFVVKRL